MNDNEEDVRLLHQHPDALLVKYQELFKMTVMEFIRSKLVRVDEYDEVIQTINLEMLDNLPTIRRNYDGRARLRTYVTKLATNTCLKFARDRKVHVGLETVKKNPHVASDSASHAALLSEAADLFHATLDLFGPRLPRILVLLKLYCKLNISMDDVSVAYPGASARAAANLVKHFGTDYSGLKEKIILEKAAPSLNALEGTRLTAESYRRSINILVREICVLLNGNPPTSSFDYDDIKILVEDFFYPFLGRRGYK
jgi:DNA-directed RNA polymerase specialized sigma24 family protein